MASNITKHINKLNQALDLLSYGLKLMVIKKGGPRVKKGRKPKKPKKPRPALARLVPKKVWVKDPTKRGGGYWAIRHVNPDTGEIVIPDTPEYELHPELAEELVRVAEEVSPEEEEKRLKETISTEAEQIKKRIEKLPEPEKHDVVSSITDLIFTTAPPTPATKRRPPKGDRPIPEEDTELFKELEVEVEPTVVIDPVTGENRPEFRTGADIVEALTEGKAKWQNLTPKERDRLFRSNALQRMLNSALRRARVQSWIKQAYRDDILQELRIKLVEDLLPKYESEKASLDTYLYTQLPGYAEAFAKRLARQVPPTLKYKLVKEDPSARLTDALELYERSPALASKRLGPIALTLIERLVKVKSLLSRRMWELAEMNAWMKEALAAQLKEIEERGEHYVEGAIPRGLRSHALNLWKDLEVEMEKFPGFKRRVEEELKIRSAKDLHKLLHRGWEALVDTLRRDKLMQKLWEEYKTTEQELQDELKIKARVTHMYNLLKGYLDG